MRRCRRESGTPRAIAAAAVVAMLAATAPGTVPAQFRRADPPVRQPMLIRPIPPAELAPPPAPRPAEPAITTRPGIPSENQDRFYDPAGPAFLRLQKAHEALAGFPVDRAGFVDWVAALGAGRISPRADIAGTSAAAPHEPDVIMPNTREMPWVRFPHGSHSQWLDCANCHPEPFAGKAGAASVTMESIFRGQACGMCHGKVAFPAWIQCERCHSVARTGEGGLYERAAPTSR